MERKYLLDTDIVIELLRKNANVIKRIEQVKRKNCFISEITIAELYFGAAKSERYEQQVKDVETIMSFFKIIPIFECFPLYGQLRWQLQSKGLKIGDLDIFIGATAIAKGLTMVTGNTAHFERLQNIQLENWKIRS